MHANVEHGRPLPLADRKAAAARILQAFPAWSDRAVARASGLSAATVARLRTDAGTARIGRDGRVRPADINRRRRLAAEMFARQPGASLRQVAAACGISPTTARDVRERMRRGDDPVRAAQRRPGPEQPEPVRRPGDVEALLRGLRRDPSLRFTEPGRALLRRLAPRVGGPAGFDRFAGEVPPHCRYALTELPRACAEQWHEFAEQLDRPSAPRHPRPGAGGRQFLHVQPDGLPVGRRELHRRPVRRPVAEPVHRGLRRSRRARLGCRPC